MYICFSVVDVLLFISDAVTLSSRLVPLLSLTDRQTDRH